MYVEKIFVGFLITNFCLFCERKGEVTAVNSFESSVKQWMEKKCNYPDQSLYTHNAFESQPIQLQPCKDVEKKFQLVGSLIISPADTFLYELCQSIYTTSMILCQSAQWNEAMSKVTLDQAFDYTKIDVCVYASTLVTSNVIPPSAKESSDFHLGHFDKGCEAFCTANDVRPICQLLVSALCQRFNEDQVCNLTTSEPVSDAASTGTSIDKKKPPTESSASVTGVQSDGPEKTVTSLDERRPKNQNGTAKPNIPVSSTTGNNKDSTAGDHKEGTDSDLPPKPSDSTNEHSSQADDEKDGATAKPQAVDATAKPQAVNATAKPQPVNATAKPQPVNATAKPQAVNATAKPQAVNATAKPQAVVITSKPLTDINSNLGNTGASTKEELPAGNDKGDVPPTAETNTMAPWLNKNKIESNKLVPEVGDNLRGQPTPQPSMPVQPEKPVNPSKKPLPYENENTGNGIVHTSDETYDDINIVQGGDQTANKQGDLQTYQGGNQPAVLSNQGNLLNSNVQDSKEQDYQIVKEKIPSSGHFFAYFLTAVVICISGYIIFHNKQKILAFIVEGRSGGEGGRRRGNGTVEYTKLKSNVEEVMPSLDKATTAQNFVY